MSSLSATTRSIRLRVNAVHGLILVALLSSCDCEDRARSVVDRSPDERRITKPKVELFEREPNDAPERANRLELGRELRPYPAAIQEASDVDWYEVVVPAGPEIFAVEVQPSADLDVSIHLQIPGHEGLPIAYKLAGLGQPESVVSIRFSKTPTRIAVRGEGGTQGDYRLIFKRRMPGGIVEWEPNDVASVANALTLPGEIEGFVDRPDDRDVFVIQPVAEGVSPVLKFDFRPVLNLPQVVRFYGDEALQTELLSLQVAGQKGQSTSIPNFMIPEGVERIWLVLTAPSGFDRKSAYRVSFQLLPDPARDMEMEPNDAVPQPWAVPSKVRGIFHSASDVDRFGVGIAAQVMDVDGPNAVDAGPDVGQDMALGEVDAGPDAGRQSDAGVDMASMALVLPQKTSGAEILIVKAAPSRKGVKIGGTLSGPDGERRIEAGLGGVVSVCDVVYHPGQHEFWVHPIEVDASRALGIDYTVEFSTSSSIRGFENEPNNTMATADVLGGRNTGFLPTADTDVWAFAVEGLAGVEAVSLRATSATPILLRVVDAEGAAIAMSAASKTHALGLDLPRGVYFLEVKSDVDLGCEPYVVERVQGR